MIFRTLSFNPELTQAEATEIAKEQPYFTKFNYISKLDEFLNSNIEIRKLVAF